MVSPPHRTQHTNPPACTSSGAFSPISRSCLHFNVSVQSVFPSECCHHATNLADQVSACMQARAANPAGAFQPPRATPFVTPRHAQPAPPSTQPGSAPGVAGAVMTASQGSPGRSSSGCEQRSSSQNRLSRRGWRTQGKRRLARPWLQARGDHPPAFVPPIRGKGRAGAPAGRPTQTRA